MRRFLIMAVACLACVLFFRPCFATYWSDFVYDYHDLDGNGLFNGGIDYNGDGFFNGSDKKYKNAVSPEMALGEPDASYVSILSNEYIIVGFNKAFINGLGYDLCIVETGMGGEVGQIYVSNNGGNFSFVGTIRVPSSGSQSTQYGTRYWFDLGTLSGPFKYVKICGSEGGTTAGFDLSGVGAQTPVPVPGTALLLTSGLLSILGVRRMRPRIKT